MLHDTPTPIDPAGDPLDWFAGHLTRTVTGVEVGSYPEQWQRAILGIVAPVLDGCRSEAATALADASDTARTACRLWLRTPPPSLLPLLTGAFVEDMIRRKKRDVGATSVNWFDRHLAEIRTDSASRTAFFTRYPLLPRLVAPRLRNWRDAAVEFALRLQQDLPAIATLLGVNAPRVTDVEAGLGDPHHGQRTVAVVTFDSGRIAYKPQPVRLVTGLRRFLDILATQHGVTVDVRLPAAIDCGDHGWLEWIDAQPCDSDEAARRYYRRLGHLHALAWLLGTDDLHSDNIVAAGDRPCLVDVETLLTPAPQGSGPQAGPARPAILAESPLGTGILPDDIPVGDGEFVDHSAFGDHPAHPTPTVTTWADAGTSDMRPDRRRLPPRHPASVPVRPGGQPVDAFIYANDFVEGARRAFDDLARVGDILARSALPATLWQGTRTRVVLRDTVEYALAQLHLRDPSVLRDPTRVDEAFARLEQHQLHPSESVNGRIRAAERRALLDGDIPYFVSLAHQRVLHMDGGDEVVPDFFAASPLERLRARADRLRHARAALLWTTTAAIRSAMLNRDTATAAGSPGPDRSGQVRGTAVEGGPALLRAAQAIGERLAALAYDDGTDVSWLTLSDRHDGRWRVVVTDESLSSGRLGILLFLEALCRTGPQSPQVDRIRARLRRGWLASEPTLTDDGRSGLFHGVAGDLYVTARIAATAGGADQRALHERLTRTVAVLRDSAPPLRPDLHCGTAGILLALSRLPASHRDEALPVAAEYAEHLLATAPHGGRGHVPAHRPAGRIVDFAHSSAAIRHALRGFAETAPARYASLAQRCRAAAREFAGWEAALWSGDALSRDTLAAEVISAWGGDPAQEQLRPRHQGDLVGLSELLLVSAEALGRPEWRARAAQLGALLARDVLANGGAVTLGPVPGVDLPGLVDGAAGVGHQLLRIASPSVVPSLLLFEQLMPTGPERQ